MLLLLLQGQNRKIFVPAGFAAKRRNVQIPPEESKQGVHVFGRDALQGGIAANRAVRVDGIAERHQPGMEAGTTALATPGVNAENAENMIGSRLAARPARAILFADGAVHLGRWIPLRMVHRIGQMPRGGKGLWYPAYRVQ
jgi:hypothetical protein